MSDHLTIVGKVFEDCFVIFKAIRKLLNERSTLHLSFASQLSQPKLPPEVNDRYCGTRSGRVM